MMFNKRISIIFLISLFVITNASVSIVCADDPPFPGIPHAFWGTVKFESGEDVGNGTIVLAVVDGENYSTTVTNGTYGYYTPFHVEDPENDNQGLLISFYVDKTFTDQTAIFESGTTNLNLTVAKVSSNDGSSHDPGGGSSGMPPSEPVAPVAVITSENYAFVNVSRTFDASNSSDSDGEIVSYSWNFGDDSLGSGTTVSHTYNETGMYTVSLLVTDNDGLTDIDEISVSVMNDADDDQWGDEEETEYGTDPENESDYPSDFDNDHIPDKNDTDDDNDGLPDSIEIELGSNPMNPNDVFMLDQSAIEGFLVNNDNDKMYDVFVDKSLTNTSKIKIDETNTYLLDVDFDGRSDYSFDIENNALNVINEPWTVPWVWIIIILGVIGGIALSVQLFSNKSSNLEERKWKKR